ncbi:MAG: sigma-70 family RNA polymerase sigma factor [Rubrivivax sp.]|nr:sigma-70 family RNA polymerase sigma factor [Rubrivivax sp.]
MAHDAGSAASTAPPQGAAPAAAWSERSQELALLLGRAGLGDRRAFAQLYEHTSGYLFGLVLRIQRDRAVAEEVLQEVYVTLWKTAAGFDAARSQPLTWLTHIARNRAIDSLRRAETQPRTAEFAAGPADDDDDGDAARRRALEALPDEAAGPLELLNRASEARQLGRCMEHLSAAQRQCVALAFYDGLSHSEVATRLRQPLGTVKSWVRRALLALKSCLDHAVARDLAPAGAAGTGAPGTRMAPQALQALQATQATQATPAPRSAGAAGS